MHWFHVQGTTTCSTLRNCYHLTDLEMLHQPKNNCTVKECQRLSFLLTHLSPSAHCLNDSWQMLILALTIYINQAFISCLE